MSHGSNFPASEEPHLLKAQEQTGLRIKIHHIEGRGAIRKGDLRVMLLDDRNYAPFWKAWRKARGDE